MLTEVLALLQLSGNHKALWVSSTLTALMVKMKEGHLYINTSFFFLDHMTEVLHILF